MILLSSDVDPITKTPDYYIQFKGIDGGGKNYEVTKLLDHFNKAIYNTFNTGYKGLDSTLLKFYRCGWDCMD